MKKRALIGIISLIATSLQLTLTLQPAKAALVTSGLVLNLDASIASSWNGTTWADQSGAGRNATAVNAPAYNASDGSFSFNGTNQYFNLGNILSQTSAFSIEVTFATNTTSVSQTLVGRQNTAVAGNYFLGISNAKTNSYVESSPWGLNSASTITTGTKYTATMVYDSSKVITPYINGLQNGVATSFPNTLYTNSINLLIGAMLTSNAADGFFNGKIYSVRMWNRALTSTEVDTNYRVNSDVVLGTTGTTTMCNYPTSMPYAYLMQAGTTSTVNKLRFQVTGTTSDAAFLANRFEIYADNSGVMGSLIGSFSPETITSSATLGGSSLATRVASYTGSATLTSGSRFWLKTNSNGSSMSLCVSNGFTTKSSGWAPVMTGSNYYLFNGGYTTYNGIYILEVFITNANLNPSISAPTLSGAARKGQAVTITVTADSAGKVRFFLNGKKIPGCLAQVTSGSAPTFTATCNWKPPVQGLQKITALLTTTTNGASTPTSAPLTVMVNRRATTR